MEPTFFSTPSEFRAWLQRHHDTSQELLVGYNKKGSGKPSMTWPESVDGGVVLRLDRWRAQGHR